ncbi:gamma-glutamyl-gamma-aminobutyrate hydrolase family protein [Rathayibacter sp. VKM Ac-2803]|uniref:gamma-glutamyl-gamma-aminobutyrate hydrolase family protein n=1 Tax=Rathayibacter sp. VKM Ac-2803 TaxID=2609256 RepID=UPI001951341C|nr:gamma-glutamyl-gamma-aminobutyrate hydrolase family protein [Rathayibacter sp. VKM Ac-2803]
MNASDYSGAPVAPRPIIGLTTYRERAVSGVWDVEASFLPANYIDSVTRAGGVALLLPPQPASAETARAVVDRLDGLIVCGGKDIDPARYGQEPHPETDAPRPERDAWEDLLVSAALESDVPFLGICRGAQLLNVSLGGTLHQHLPDLVGDRRYQAGGGVFSHVDVAVEPESRLRGLLGEDSVRAQVYHHQAVDRVADGLEVAARTADGTIEALEVPGRRFALGVQWHPEEDASDARLFTGLVAAALAHRATPSAEATHA